MSIDLLYLQKSYSKNSNPLKGRKLYERLQQDSEKNRLGYIVRPGKDAVEQEFSDDVVTYEELDQLNPDLVFIEGGVLEREQWRIPEEDIERLVTRGAVVIICDVNWNILNQDKKQYERVS